MELLEMSQTPPWEWPEDADQIFLKTIKDKSADQKDRTLAVQLAGDYTVINDELADALLDVLLDTKASEEMRRQAVLSFGAAFENAYVSEFEDPEDILISEKKFHDLQAIMKRLFNDKDVPLDVRRGILEASARAPEDWHQKAVQDAYASDDELWKLTAVFCMNFIHGFDKEIIESLDHKDILVRFHAISAAGNWQVDAAWPHVTRILENEEEDIDLLLAAIESTAAIRPAECQDLIGPFLESEDEDIAETAQDALELAEALLEEEKGGFEDDLD